MDVPILTNKIHIPLLRPNHIYRPRIETQINRDLLIDGNFSRSLTLIAAPAGFGKTCLAVEWLSDVPAEKSWFSIDDNDNDPSRFLTYLINSIQTVIPEAGNTCLAMLRLPNLPPPEALLPTLVNRMAESKIPVILVLDDYHLVHEVYIHQALNFLVDHLPVNAHLVVITREDPPIPLHKLRANGRLAEIRQKDLKFTGDEASSFLRKSYAGLLPEKDILAINHRTEGWVTGLQLTVLSLRNYNDPQDMLKDFSTSSRFILDYLFQEIFQSQPKEIRDFLIKTSVLDQLSAGLCSAVTGLEDCRRTLEELDQANVFINPVDAHKEWYRYHHLFLEMLRQQLRLDKEISAEALHLKASDWYEKNGYQEESIRHALEGQHWASALELIELNSTGLLNNGRISTLLTWFKKIPTEIIVQKTQTCLDYAWPLLLSGQIEKAETFIQAAFNLDHEQSELTGHIEATAAFLAQTKGDEKELIRSSERALSLLPAEDFSGRSIIAMNLGIAYWHKGELDQAENALLAAIPAALKIENYYAVFSARFFLARILAVKGKLIQAAEAIKEVIDQGGTTPIAHLALTDLAFIHYEWNDLIKAGEIIRDAMEKIQQSGNVEFIMAGTMIDARLLAAQGKLTDALILVESKDPLIAQARIPLRSLSRWSAFKVELALAMGDIGKAKFWNEKIETEQDAHPFYRYLDFSTVRIMMSEGRFEHAFSTLGSLLKTAEEKEWRYGQAWIHIQMALTAAEEPTALSHLAQALEIGREGNLMRTFTDAGIALLALLRKAAQGHDYQEYIREIIRLIEQDQHQETSNLPAGVIQPSSREIEILALVASGMSNRQIAEKLVIGLSTVKSHLHHICTKLNAANRTQAAARARELRLID